MSASPRELATAFGILKGKSTLQAMVDAGYSVGYANTQAGKVEARLRAKGLILSAEAVTGLKERLELILVGDDFDQFDAIARRLVALARTGGETDRDALAAITAYLDRLLGKPGQEVAVRGEIEITPKSYSGFDPEDL